MATFLVCLKLAQATTWRVVARLTSAVTGQKFARRINRLRIGRPNGLRLRGRCSRMTCSMPTGRLFVSIVCRRPTHLPAKNYGTKLPRKLF